jgi:dTDP-4-dehydrorhamnose reductase
MEREELVKLVAERLAELAPSAPSGRWPTTPWACCTSMPDEREEVVLVTGTRRGIGRYLAERCAERGARVVGCSRQPAEWEADGYEHQLADVSSEQDVKRLLHGIARSHGRLDVVVNNAGVAAMNAALLTPAAAVDRITRGPASRRPRCRRRGGRRRR